MQHKSGKPPKISQDQLSNCKIFSTRSEAVQDLLKDGLRYLEIGALLGDYSEEVIKKKSPSYSCLLDMYGVFNYSNIDIRYKASEHFNFVKNRFSEFNNVELLNGDSQKVLPIENKIFDYIYIDANHSYESVKNDLYNSLSMLAEDGIIGLNDYMAIGHSDGDFYEIIYVVNEFLLDRPDFEVIGFSMNSDMYSDIYIKRKPMVQ